jgi:hypothetical protein
MKILLMMMIVAMTSRGGCKKNCDPDNIRSGRSSQNHDRKKFKASIRIMWAKQFGNMCRVRYQNMKTVIDKIYVNCDCKKFPVGTWVSVDSI